MDNAISKSIRSFFLQQMNNIRDHFVITTLEDVHSVKKGNSSN